MPNPIEPALSAKEWHLSSAALRPKFAIAELRGLYDSNGDAQPLAVEDMPKVIALANAALPDSDPRKITSRMVNELRDVVRGSLGSTGDTEGDKRLLAYVAALASYLPPEP